MAEDVLEIRDFDEVAEVLLARPRASSHLLLASLVLTVGSLLAWAALSRVDLTVNAPGTVRPSGDIATVDAQAGGAVSEVLVQEGDTVPAGAVLVRLDLSQPRAQRAGLVAALEGLRVQRENLARARASLLEQHVLDARTREEARRQAEEKARVEEQRVRVREDRARGEVRFAGLEVEHAKSTEELKQKLFEAQLGSREEWNQAVRARQLAEERWARAEQELRAIDRADVVLAGREVERLAAAEEAQKKAAQREIEKHDAEIARLEADFIQQQGKLNAVDEELGRAEVRSPVAGTIVSLAVQRAGEMVDLGQEIARVIPRGAPQVVEAYVANADIAFLKPGMPARFRFQAFPHQKYGTLPGTVIWMAPDSAPLDLPDGGRLVAYKVRLDLPAGEFRRGSEVGRVELGMVAEVGIITGRESVLSLLWRKIKEQFTP